MIPKTIHYCWFGGNPLPPLALRCIASWEKHLPGYDIKRWDESNFDVNIIPYTREAYRMKKYAFVSDYARFWILYKYGGIYFDTDVEVIKPLDDLLARGGFMGFEEDGREANPGLGFACAPGLGFACAPGLGFACAPGLGFACALLDKYATLSFINKNGTLNLTTVVTYTSDLLKEYGIKNDNTVEYIDGIYIYPRDYFCPKDRFTGKIRITPNTRTIHHFDGSWADKNFRYHAKQFIHKTMILLLGQRIHQRLVGKIRNQ